MRYMVRMMVGMLIEIGRGHKSFEEISNRLDIEEKNTCPYNANPCGLYLMKVNYWGEYDEEKLSFAYI